MALSFREKAGWGLADMGINVFVVVKQLLVFTYLTTFLGVPAGVAGFVTFAVLAFDVVTDPLVGYLSDRTQSRWGRRAPWIFVGSLILSGGIVAMFAVPEGMDWQGNLAWVFVAFAVATIGFTSVAIPYGAMAGEMTHNPRERSVMMAFRMTFASLGLLMAGAVIPAMAGDTREGYFTAVAMVAPLIVITIWGMLWATRTAPQTERQAPLEMTAALRLLTQNQGFMRLVLLYGVMTLGVALIAAGLQLASLYLIADDGLSPLSDLSEALGVFSTLFAMFIAGSVVSQYIWVKTSGALGKFWALVVGLTLYIAVLLIVWQALPAQSITPMALLFLAAGFTNGAYQQIPWAIYPDHMDDTRAKTGQAIEGAFSAVWLFGQKVANAVAPLILGLILAAAGWQESGSGVVPQTETALTALRLSLTVIPATMMAFAILGLIVFYRPYARS
ncbi:MAG: MFS transporter [Pseudomonadota bacterium]